LKSFFLQKELEVRILPFTSASTFKCRDGREGKSADLFSNPWRWVWFALSLPFTRAPTISGHFICMFFSLIFKLCITQLMRWATNSASLLEMQV
jgi:hypothetical protein